MRYGIKKAQNFKKLVFPFSHYKFILNDLTLIPPSGGIYGSQFLVDKLLEVHKGYENETIIYSSSLYGTRAQRGQVVIIAYRD